MPNPFASTLIHPFSVTTALTNNHSLIPRRLYVELEDDIAAMITRKPKFNDLHRLDYHTAEQDASDLNISDFNISDMSTANDYITFVAQPNSPFRTVSHFGFISPAKNPNPNHFHVPTERTKYVGVTTESSIEELFSTKKYLDYPDDLVPLIQRRKKITRTIIRGRVERRRRSPPKPFAILNGCREYLVHGSGQLPHQSYIKMLEKYFVETPYTCCKEAEKRDDLENIIHTLVTKMINLAETEPAETEPAQLNTIAEEASVDVKDDTTETGATTANEAQSEFITMIEIQPTDNDFVVAEYPVTDKPAFDIDALKPPGKLEVTSLVENFMKQLAESRFSNESPNLDFQPDAISTPQRRTRSLLLSRSDREARRAEFIELWEDHLDYVSTWERVATKEANAISFKNQNISENLNSSNFDSMDNLDETVADLVSSTILESSDSYEPIERTIIDKINLHQLDQDDEIFTKIKQTIYDNNNSKFEQSATNIQLNLPPPANQGKFRASTPTDANTSQPIFTQSLKPVRRTSTPKKIEEVLAVKPTKKRPIKKSFERKIKATNGYATVSSDDDHTNVSRTKRKARNFIAENIKKVAARGSRDSSTTREHKSISKSKTAVKTFMKSSTKTGSSLLWLSVSAMSNSSSTNTLNCNAENEQTTSRKHFSAFSSVPSGGLNTENRLLHTQYLQTDESAEEVPPQNIFNAAENDRPNNLSPNSKDAMVLVQKCTEHIESLRLNDIHLEMDEIFQIQNDNNAEQAAERERYEAALAEDWRSFNRIAFSLSEDED